MHVKAAHQHSVKEVTCRHCDSFYGNKELLEAHFCKYNGEVKEPEKDLPMDIKGRKCPVCPYVANRFRTNDLQQHIDSVHKKIRHACEFCAKSYAFKAHLVRHNKADHKDKLCQLTCAYGCAKVFANTDLLGKHRCVTLREERAVPLVCDICHAVFSLKATLNYHMRSQHPEAEKMKCTECEKVFFSQMALEKHRKMAH